MPNPNSNNEIIINNKRPAEIKQLIEAALIENKILGYLHNNILYMKSFGQNYSLDKIFAFIGVFTLLILTEIDEFIFSYGLIIITISLISFTLSFIFAKLLKFYLVYDIDREVFYNITNIFNYSIFRSDELSRKNIIELGVDVTDNNSEKRTDYNDINFKGKLIDNPYLKTSFIALNPKGIVEYISDPIAEKEAHQTAVARCKLFSQCFDVKATICNKDEYLLIIDDEKNNYRFEKKSRLPEWEKAKKEYKHSLWVALLVILLIPLLCYLMSFIIESSLK